MLLFISGTLNMCDQIKEATKKSQYDAYIHQMKNEEAEELLPSYEGYNELLCSQLGDCYLNFDLRVSQYKWTCKQRNAVCCNIAACDGRKCVLTA